MRLQDKDTLSVAAAVSAVLEGKVKEEGNFPHDMWSPEGEKKVAKDEAEHKALADKGYTHDKPEVEEAGEPKAKGEKDFKASHKAKKSGAKEDGTVVKEEKKVEKEGNAFTKALMAARDKGDLTFTVAGKEYKCEDYDDEDEDEDLEENSAKVDPKELASDIPQMTLSRFLKKATKAKGLYFDGEHLIASKKTKFPDKIALGDALNPKKKYTVQDLIKAVENIKEDLDEAKQAIVWKVKPPKGQKNIHPDSKWPGMKPGDIQKMNESAELDEAADKKLVKKAVETALKMGGNMTGAVKKIEKMQKGLSKDKEVAAALQLANEEVTESVVDEALAINEAKTKMQEDKERYQKFFKSALKKFGVTSPGELEGDNKKKFFDYVDANYEADNEED